METKKIKIKDINISGPIRTPVLPEGFIKSVQKYKKVLVGVETTTLEETIANFQKDQDPEKELKIWEYIAYNYQDFIKANPSLTLEEKKEALKVLLSLSMGVESFKTVKKLSKQQVQYLKNVYLKYN